MPLRIKQWPVAVGSNPRRFVLWPATLAFALAYPTIYRLLTCHPGLDSVLVQKLVDEASHMASQNATISSALHGAGRLDSALAQHADISPLAVSIFPPLDLSPPFASSSSSSLFALADENVVVTVSPLQPPLDITSAPVSPTLISLTNRLPLVLSVAVLVLLVYLFRHIGTARSKSGLALAFCVQQVLVVCSAATITRVFFPQFELNFLPLVVFVVSAVNLIQFFSSLSTISPSKPVNFKLTASASTTFTSASTLTIALLLTLLLAIASRSSLVPALLYYSLCMIFEFALFFTYCMAIIAVDLCRLELHDLLKDPYAFEEDHFTVNQYVTMSTLLPRTFVPYAGTISPLSFMYFPIVACAYWNSSMAFISGNYLVYNFASLEGSSLLAVSKVVPYIDQITAPSQLPASFSFLFLEFACILTFILAFTAIVLRFVVPNTTVLRNESSLSYSPRVLLSKDLIASNCLDFIFLDVHNRWIAGVSLDHQIVVWDLNKPPAQQLVARFRSPVWPITRFNLDGPNDIVALFSESTISVWDYKRSELKAFLKDPQMLANEPIKSYFSGQRLIVVTQDGHLLSISTVSDKITTYVIKKNEATGNPEKILSARILLTTRLPERLICLTESHSIIVCTWYAKMEQWSFHHLLIREWTTNGDIVQKVLNINDRAVYIAPVHELNIALVASYDATFFIDIHSGNLMRKLQLGNYKSSSVKVFHSQPTHCRFCGCVAVQSLSIVYSEADNPQLVICHTFTIDNRAKNTICIRSERDLRETRCLGLEATTERQHWMTNAEGWDVTDINMVMGVRRKEVPFQSTTAESPTSGSQRHATVDSLSRRNNNTQQNKRSPHIDTTWEGWAMSSTGFVTYYNIPEMAFDRLLIMKIGPVAKYGRKSIAVVFGNEIKVLYFGNEETFIEDDNYDDERLDQHSGARKWRRRQLIANY